MRLRQPEAGANERGQGESGERSDQIPASCVARVASSPSLCGVCVASGTARVLDAPGSLPPPSSWKVAAGRALLLPARRRYPSRARSAPRRALSRPHRRFLEAAGCTGAPWARREAAGAVGVIGTNSSRPCRQARVLGPPKPLVGEGGHVGLGIKEAAGRKRVQEGDPTAPQLQGVWEELAEPSHGPFPGQVPPLGLILKAILIAETCDVKAASRALWGLFQERLG